MYRKQNTGTKTWDKFKRGEKCSHAFFYSQSNCTLVWKIWRVYFGSNNGKGKITTTQDCRGRGPPKNAWKRDFNKEMQTAGNAGTSLNEAPEGLNEPPPAARIIPKFFDNLC